MKIEIPVTSDLTYAVRGIAEYWIANPQANKVTVLTLIEELYAETVLAGSEIILSNIVSGLQLAAEEILGAGKNFTLNN